MEMEGGGMFRESGHVEERGRGGGGTLKDAGGKVGEIDSSAEVEGLEGQYVSIFPFDSQVSDDP